MTDIVFNTDSYETLLADAKSLGFTYTDENGVDRIIVNGPMKSGGNYFLNYVGTVYQPTVNPDDTPVAYPGVWGRLRANGETSDLPSFSSAITQYVYSPDASGWVNAATGIAAPDYVSNIGVIA